MPGDDKVGKPIETRVRCAVAARGFLLISVAFSAVLAMSGGAGAESLAEAMASAYSNNPTLNAARAGTRAADEAVPQALAGYRPQISAYVQGGVSGVQSTSPSRGLFSSTYTTSSTGFSDVSIETGVQIVQPIYTGGRTENGVKAAESAVKASRESLRNTEQGTLMDAVTVYMDVIATRQLLDLRKSNVEFLKEQVRAASDRFTVGEGTRTDVSQAEAALAAAEAQVSLAEANALAAGANYLQVIGHKPSGLAVSNGATKLLPSKLDTAIDASRKEHPAILAAIHNSDTASFNVKIAEGALLPTFSITGTIAGSADSYGNSGNYGDGSTSSVSASVMGRLSIPIYQGGSEYSEVRQAKETLGQRKIEVDAARDQVNSSLIAAWGTLESARAQIDAAKAGVEASQLALEGVIEEQKVGQRTTLDVLNAQSTLITQKVTQVSAQRDLVVASYAVLSAMGRLDHQHLGLKVAAYKPEQHYTQVRDKWIGLRTPDGR